MRTNPAKDRFAPEAAAKPAAKPLPSVSLSVATAPKDNQADEFSEVPTVANRTNPTVTADERSPASRVAAGAYRMVRPATSDTITAPLPPKIGRKTSRGVIIGVARKLG